VGQIKQNEKEKYLNIWKNFSRNLKEGVVTDFENKEKIADLLLQQKIAGVTAKYIAGFENSKNIRLGHFEIWFAPDAFQ